LLLKALGAGKVLAPKKNFDKRELLIDCFAAQPLALRTCTSCRVQREISETRKLRLPRPVATGSATTATGGTGLPLLAVLLSAGHRILAAGSCVDTTGTLAVLVPSGSAGTGVSRA
jgi:hypothetical protein